MHEHVEDPAAYQRAIKERMIRNGIKGRLTRLADEAPMVYRLIEEVIEPRRRRAHDADNERRRKLAERDGHLWDSEPFEYYPLFDLRPDRLDQTTAFVYSIEWSEVEWYSFPEQLVLRYLKTKKGLSPKQDAWVTKMVEEEPQREAKAAERKAERQAADAASEHVGAVKDRLKGLVATVEFTKTIEGHYGSKKIVKMRDDSGNVLVTFATSEWVWGVERGQQVTLDATVKAHETYEGTKQTVLTRTKRTDA